MLRLFLFVLRILSRLYFISILIFIHSLLLFLYSLLFTLILDSLCYFQFIHFYFYFDFHFSLYIHLYCFLILPSHLILSLIPLSFVYASYISLSPWSFYYIFLLIMIPYNKLHCDSMILNGNSFSPFYFNVTFTFIRIFILSASYYLYLRTGIHRDQFLKHDVLTTSFLKMSCLVWAS